MQGQWSVVASPCRPTPALLCDVDVYAPVQPTNLTESTGNPAPSSNEVLRSVERHSSATAIDSVFHEPTQDPATDAESCSGLAEIQASAIDLFSVNSNTLSIPTDIQIIDYTDPDESLEDDPPLKNPDPSFDRDNPSRVPKDLPLNSIAPSQHPFAPYDPDAIRGQFDTGAGVSCTNLKYLLHGYRPFTKQHPSPITMSAAIDKSDQQTASTVPLGLGYLRLESPTAPNGVGCCPDMVNVRSYQ